MTHTAAEPRLCNRADLNNADELLSSAYATLDLFFMLACAGDLESLHENTVTSTIAEVMTKIEEARKRMQPVTPSGLSAISVVQTDAVAEAVRCESEQEA